MIPIAKPHMGSEETAAASRVISTGWVTQGPEIAAFEKDFANYVGADYACAVSNCTAALHLALLAVGVGAGDQVVTVSHSFIATANAVRYCGAEPVFVDIERDGFNIDPTLIEQAISQKTKAILCVHQMGMPCDLKAILEIGHRNGIPVVEDAACAIGSEILVDGEWQRIGRPHGDVACFSFHPRKIITTGDGGMLTTSNPEYDSKFRLWRQHGMSVPDTRRHASREVVFESYDEFGFNYRMTDIQAAVGREQIKRLPEIISRRRYLADRYMQLLSGQDKVKLPVEPEWAKSNWQSFCVKLPTRISQRAVMQAMLDSEVATRRGIMCAHREQPYMLDIPRQDLSRSEYAQDHAIILPLYHQMTDEEQDYVVERLVAAVKKAEAAPREEIA